MSRAKKTEPSAVRQVVVEGLDASGHGLITLEGRTFACPGLLPGDKVAVEPGEKGDDYWTIKERVADSPDRIKPDCPFHGPCGGCDLLELSEKGRVKAKDGILRRALATFSDKDSLTIHPFVAAKEIIRYRHRVRLHQGFADGNKIAGFLRARGPEADDGRDCSIIPVTACALLKKELGQRLVAARRALAALPIKVRGLYLACSTEGGDAVAGHVVLAGKTSANRAKPLMERLIGAADLSGLSLGPDDGTVEAVIGSVKLLGLVAPGVAGGPYAAEPAVFTQGNAAQNRRMIEWVLKIGGVKPGMKVLEGFAGAGNFSLACAAAGATVEAWESHPGAVRCGERNRRQSGCADRLSLHVGDAHTALFKAAPEPDLLLVDPPRTGMPGIADIARKLKPARIVYVACDPESLSRDGSSLSRAGYRAVEAVGIDLYPRTHHLEAVVAFVPKGE